MSIKKLEQLAKGHPSLEQETWEKVVEVFDRLPEARLPGAVERFEAVTGHWPTRVDGWSGFDGSADYEVRRAPLHWVKEVYSGEHSVKHRIIRILESPRRPMRGQALPQLISEAAQLHNLEQVSFAQVKVPGTFLKQLKGEGPWQRWSVFRAWTCDLKPAQLKVLAKVPFDALRSLVLTQNRFGPAGAAALVKAPGLEGITDLEAGYNGIGLEGAQSWAGASWLSGLKRLSLENNQLDDAALEALVGGGLLAELETLLLEYNPAGAAPGGWLAHLPVLRRLRMEKTALSDAGLAEILAAPCGDQLVELNVTDRPLTDASAHAMVDRGLALESLSCSGTEMTEEGVCALLTAPSMQGLKRLALGKGFTPKAVQALIDGALPALESLWWHGPEVDEAVDAMVEGHSRLKKACVWMR